MFFQQQVDQIILPGLERCFSDIIAQMRQLYLAGTTDYLKETKTMSSLMIDSIVKKLPDPKYVQVHLEQQNVMNQEAQVRQKELIGTMR